MKYKSTRGGGGEYTFEEALFAGYAPDGGLFVPVSLPCITANEHLIPWSTLTFAELAYSVIVSLIE
jgi:threonine synthase